MPSFSYVARNSDGKVIRGTTEAQNQSMVARMLRDQGMTPTTIESGGATATQARKAGGRGGKVKLDDLVLFTRQFATMIRAGLPLIEVLNILAEQTEKRSMKVILKQVERDVETGSSLTEAIQRHPKVFSTFYISMIRAGETAGMLDSILDQVAHYLEKVASVQRKVKAAIMYPAVVSTVAIGITVFLMIKVVPVFSDIFSELGGDLPLPTKITVAISNFLQNHFLLAAAMLAGTVLIVWQASRTTRGRQFLDHLKLKMPVFGPLLLKVSVARFTRTLGTLIRSGVNILNALDIVAKTSGNVIVEAAIVKTRASIQSGESIANPLRDSQVFPPMVVRMIDVGERTGALESMLTKIADFYEDQIDAAVASLTSIIEPILIVFLGTVVGFIVISMFMPMFKMIDMVSD
jgi:type IV pilus assembly protein PilC